jgi:hypothetical protein
VRGDELAIEQFAAGAAQRRRHCESREAVHASGVQAS